MTTYTEFNSDMFLCNSLDSLTVYSHNNDIKYISKSLKDATFYYIDNTTFTADELTELKTLLKSKSSSSEPPFNITTELFNRLNRNTYDYNGFINADKNLKPISKWMYTFGQLTKTTAKVQNDKIEIGYENN